MCNAGSLPPFEDQDVIVELQGYEVDKLDTPSITPFEWLSHSLKPNFLPPNFPGVLHVTRPA